MVEHRADTPPRLAHGDQARPTSSRRRRSWRRSHRGGPRRFQPRGIRHRSALRWTRPWNLLAVGQTRIRRRGRPRCQPQPAAHPSTGSPGARCPQSRSGTVSRGVGAGGCRDGRTAGGAESGPERRPRSVAGGARSRVKAKNGFASQHPQVDQGNSGTRNIPFTVHRSPFTVHRSLVTGHWSRPPSPLTVAPPSAPPAPSPSHPTPSAHPPCRRRARRRLATPRPCRGSRAPACSRGSGAARHRTP